MLKAAKPVTESARAREIEMSPEDARPHLFRGVVHALQSRKGGLLGPSRAARECNKTEALRDLEWAVDLTQDDLLSEQAARWKEKAASF